MLRNEIRSHLPEHLDTLERIVKATSRMGRIVDNVRTFGRQIGFQLKSTVAIAPLNDALDLVSEQLRIHEIEVEKDFSENLPKVIADSVQLQQVFLNLLSNARDALDGLASTQPKRLLLRVRTDMEYVSYVVQDNGPGIPDEVATQIFDPFFTTKPPGKGMGLGLSLSYGIIKDHEGDMVFEPVPTGGARFVVQIPIAELQTQRSHGTAGAAE